ncbi:MAG: hypothetical protein HQ517_15310 [SAR324 cluster bacterium]|nr:hypothetical protein [SAR324 cluster bacterium]
MNEFCRSILRFAGKKGFFVGMMLLFLFPMPNFAMDHVIQGGMGITTQAPTLFGYAVSLNLRGNSQKNSWFSDTQLIYHRLQSLPGAEEEKVSATITFESVELNWFLLFPGTKGNGMRFFWGPGIGYGVAEIREDVNSNGRQVKEDPSTFFTANDIHYGTLLLKLGLSWNNKTCEGRLSSFGGLIGGTVLCGIFY